MIIICHKIGRGQYSKLKFTLPPLQEKDNFILRKKDAVIISWGFFREGGNCLTDPLEGPCWKGMWELPD